MISLNALEVDALAEIFNLSLGEASATFSEIVQEEIHLSVPSVEILSREELIGRLEAIPRNANNNKLCSIAQHFESDKGFETEALLLFPERGSLEIVRRMLGDNASMIEHLSELEQDALGEVGNIIINSCMSSLANLFTIRMNGTLPDVKTHSAREMFLAHDDSEVILVAQIGMTMRSYDITGYVLFIMDLNSMSGFMKQVRHYFRIEEGQSL